MLVKRVSKATLFGASAALAISLALASAAHAQSANYGPTPATFPTVDPNGVDLTTGNLVLSDLNASVGQPGEGGLSRMFMGPGPRDNLSAAISETSAGTPQNPDQTLWTVSLGSTSAVFVQINTTAPLKPFANATGRTLRLDSGANTFTFTDRDGSVAMFNFSTGLITQVTRPNGEVLTYRYSPLTGSCGANCLPQSVTSSLGYMLHYDYVASSITPGYYVLSKVTAINRATAACDEGAASCTLDPVWSSTTFVYTGTSESTGTLQATDTNGNVTTYQISNGQVTQITSPTGVVRAIGYSAGKVNTVTVGGRTWTYTFTTPQTSVLQAVIQDPVGHTQTVATSTTVGQVLSVTDGMTPAHTTSYHLDDTGQVTDIVFPEGDVTTYAYDVRGNVTSVTRGAKSAASSKTVMTATFDAVCANSKTCNQASAVVDVSGARTDFTYDPNSGLLSSVTQPAGVNGVRPKTTFTLAALTPTYLNGSSQTISGAPVWKPTDVSRCMTLASCAGGADEVHTTLSYGTGSPNNLQIVSRTERDGASTLTAQIQYTYNRFGDLRTIDGPLAGTGDTVRFRYDAMRNLNGKVFEDPDGQSTGRPALAEKIIYTPDGLVSFIQYGTVPSQSDADWANSFSKRYTLAYVRDAFARVVQEKVNDSNGVTQSLTQYGFYDNDQLKCSAIRMNPGAFTALPADACALGAQGAFGPDRIAQFTYDGDGRLAQRVDALGTGVQTTSQVLTYTANGQLQGIADGKNNLTTLTYDDFDRQAQMQFPSPTTPGQSSSTDLIQNAYDVTTWNLTSMRLRDGQSVAMAYDARRNLTSESLTGTTYSYDNFDRPTTSTAGGQTLTEAYDALGRKTSETGPMGAVASAYDLAGRRTRLTLPSGFFTTYDYDTANLLIDIKDSTGAALATFNYDSSDRLSGITRLSGVNTTYGYDSLSRPTSIAHSFAAGASSNNLSITLSYDPASEATSRTLSNSAYQWTGAESSATYTLNGLNQIAAANGVTFTHDGRGNLTSDGAKAYAYDAGNRLTAAGALGVTWDPADRLYQTTVGATVTRFVYDGQDVVAEYDGAGNEQKRYVNGLGADQHLAIFENGTANWPLADERGSIIAVATNAGGALALNTYDEYGKPAAGNYGRFQYTGQMWMPDAGLYHYKARAYSPQLGRFMQPDPVGYLGGANLYAYANNNPISGVDPLGTDPTVSEVVVIPNPFGSIGSLAGGAGSAGFPHLHPTNIPGLMLSDEITVEGKRTAKAAPPVEDDRRRENIFTCAARVSNKMSIAGYLNVNAKQHPIGAAVLNAFAGNTFGGAVDFVRDVSNLPVPENAQNAALGLVLAGPAQGLVSPTAKTFLGVGGSAAQFANKGLAGVATDAVLNGIYGASKVAPVSGLAAEGLAGPIGLIKLTADAGIFLGSLYYCHNQ
jgi:RHS repeat-associated protein